MFLWCTLPRFQCTTVCVPPFLITQHRYSFKLYFALFFLRGRGGVPSPSIHPFTHTHTRARAFNASDVPLPKLSCSRCELTECLTSRPHALHGPRLQLRLQVFLHDGKQLREVDRAFPAWGAERSLQQACLSCQAVPVTAAWWCYRGSTRARAHVCTV